MSGSNAPRTGCAPRTRGARLCLASCGHWLLGCLLVACGGATRDPPPGSDVVHTPPPNADSLHRVSVQLHYEASPESEDAAPGVPKKPLGGWEIEARWLAERVPESAPYDSVAAEAVERTDVSGVAVFWLEHAGPYDFSTVEQDHVPRYCWWVGAVQWEGDSPEVMLELSLGCT